jgi:alanyl-tRNA synthetase
VHGYSGKNFQLRYRYFQPLIREIGKISGTEYGKDEKIDVAMRVVSDHIRAIAFSIADGQLPSNIKAGYVIRRILRRPFDMDILFCIACSFYVSID